MDIYIIDTKAKFIRYLKDINILKGYPKTIKAQGANIAGTGIHKDVTMNNYCAIFENKKTKVYGIEICDVSREVILADDPTIKTDTVMIEKIQEEEWFKID